LAELTSVGPLQGYPHQYSRENGLTATSLRRLGRFTRVNLSLTISGHHFDLLDARARLDRHRIWSDADLSIYPSGGVSDMSVDNVRSEANPLFAFTLIIVGAFTAGLPLAVAIIWICS
jgi:hypothetical protein